MSKGIGGSNPLASAHKLKKTKMKQKSKEIIKFFVLPIIGFSFLFLVIYVVGQQNLRMGANDPQIQIAEDTALSFSKNEEPVFIKNNKDKNGKDIIIDMKKSLLPFIMLYDKDFKLILSSARLGENVVEIPMGVLENAKKKGETRITWEPEKGVRNAIIVVYFKDVKEGYLISGRSLREVEYRTSQLNSIVLLSWFIFVSMYGVWYSWINKDKN